MPLPFEVDRDLHGRPERRCGQKMAASKRKVMVG